MLKNDTDAFMHQLNNYRLTLLIQCGNKFVFIIYLVFLRALHDSALKHRTLISGILSNGVIPGLMDISVKATVSILAVILHC